VRIFLSKVGGIVIAWKANENNRVRLQEKEREQGLIAKLPVEVKYDNRK